MKNLLNTLIAEEEHKEFKELISFITGTGTDIVLRNGILQLFRSYCEKYEKPKPFREDSSIFAFFKIHSFGCRKISIFPPSIVFYQGRHSPHANLAIFRHPQNVMSSKPQ